MKQLRVKIISNEKEGADFRRMRIKSAYLAGSAKPGQFVEIRCAKGVEVLLRRPLGVHKVLKNGIEILYEIVGKGTMLLSEKRKGEYLDLIGPLGNGFDLSRPPEAAILVAGGIGVAPLLALAEKLAYSVERIADRGKKKNAIHVFIGAKTKSHILCENEFKKMGCKVSVSTENGSRGNRGLVTDHVKVFLNAIRYPLNATIYACGPTGMLKAVADIAKSHRIGCQVSLEERMACGVGVCLGCPVKVRRLASSPVSQFKQANRPTGQPANYDYKMVCKDGPVFNAEEIAW